MKDDKMTTYVAQPELFSWKSLHIDFDKLYNSLFCGGVAGIAAKTCIAPLERIKMSFQVSQEKFTFKSAYLRGQSYIQNGGFFALWRGHSTTVLRVGPYAGLSYAFHDYSEQVLMTHFKTKKLSAFYKFLCGAISGFGGTALTYPLDVLRVRLALGKTWKDSIRQGGFYQGLLPTLMGIVPYSGTGWLVKQTLLDMHPLISNVPPTILESLGINAIAGLIGQFVTYPLDVLRRRMQIAESINGQTPRLRDVVYNLIKTEGFKGFGKGFSLNIIKGPISLSISLTVYDFLRSLSGIHYNKDAYSKAQ